MIFPSLDENGLREVLEASGRRFTPQRSAVYAYLSKVDQHPTAEDVYQGVRPRIPNISLATVYKSLEALVEAGLATKIESSHSSARYDARSDHHYHLRCLRSGAVEDLSTPFDPDLIAKLDPSLGRSLEERGFHLTGYRLELVGYFKDENHASESADTPTEQGN